MTFAALQELQPKGASCASLRLSRQVFPLRRGELHYPPPPQARCQKIREGEAPAEPRSREFLIQEGSATSRSHDDESPNFFADSGLLVGRRRLALEFARIKRTDKSRRKNRCNLGRALTPRSQ